jgi:hypothetical protein
MQVNYGCDGKVQYRTYTEAKKKVRAMKRNKHLDKGHQMLDFYRCRTCSFWHIGNSNGLDKIKRNRYKGGQHDRRSKLAIENY